jgi:hypothetical protein
VLGSHVFRESLNFRDRRGMPSDRRHLLHD